MLIDGRFSVAAPPERLLAHLFDARLMAECLPGCESLQALADDRYRAVVVVSLAGIKARFDLEVEVTERRADGIRALTRGEEGGNASRLSATSDVRLDAGDDGTQLAYTSEVSVTGRFGRFALGMMKKKAQAMGDEFAANLKRRLSSESAAAPDAVDAQRAGVDGARAAGAATPVEAPAALAANAPVEPPAAVADGVGTDATVPATSAMPAAADTATVEATPPDTAEAPRP